MMQPTKHIEPIAMPNGNDAETSSAPYVLIVDDDYDARNVVRLMLNQFDVRSEEAVDGVQAMEIIQNSAPTLIVLDLMMPKMDGFQLLNHLRGNPRTRHIPVIVITGVQHGLDMLLLPGVETVLRKGSYTIQELKKIVDRLLTGNSTKTQWGHP